MCDGASVPSVFAVGLAELDLNSVDTVDTVDEQNEDKDECDFHAILELGHDGTCATAMAVSVLSSIERGGEVYMKWNIDLRILNGNGSTSKAKKMTSAASIMKT